MRFAGESRNAPHPLARLPGSKSAQGRRLSRTSATRFSRRRADQAPPPPSLVSKSVLDDLDVACYCIENPAEPPVEPAAAAARSAARDIVKFVIAQFTDIDEFRSIIEFSHH